MAQQWHPFVACAATCCVRLSAGVGHACCPWSIIIAALASSAAQLCACAVLMLCCVCARVSRHPSRVWLVLLSAQLGRAPGCHPPPPPGCVAVLWVPCDHCIR